MKKNVNITDVYEKASKMIGDAVIGAVFSTIMYNATSAIVNKIKNRKEGTIGGVKLVRAEKEED